MIVRCAGRPTVRTSETTILLVIGGISLNATISSNDVPRYATVVVVFRFVLLFPLPLPIPVPFPFPSPSPSVCEADTIGKNFFSEGGVRENFFQNFF